MTLKDRRTLRRKFTPQYSKNYNVPALVISLIWFFLGLAVAITIGLLLGEHIATYIAMIVWFVGCMVVLIVALVLIIKLRNRIIKQRTQEISEEFTDMPLEEATAAVTERKIINDIGFIANIGEYAGELIVPFGDAKVTVYCGNIYTKIFTAITISNMSGAVIAEYIADNALYNYILKKSVKVDFQGNSKYLVNDKITFVKKNFNADGEKTAMWFLFGALGAFLSDEANNVNLSRKIVLRIVGKEYLQ